VTFPAPEGFSRNDLFLAEMRHFLAVAKGEAQPVCTLQDGVRALELALAARRSAEQGILVKVETFFDE
jgi:predicted dehydrogenase